MQIHGRLERASQTPLREAEIGMIRSFASWTHWLGLPFRRGLSDSRANKALRRFARELAAQTRAGHTPIAWASGPQADGKLHFHALAALEPELYLVEPLIRALWRQADPLSVERGYVREYDPSRGAIAYMLEHPDHGHGTACARRPRCRRKGCPHTSPW